MIWILAGGAIVFAGALVIGLVVGYDRGAVAGTAGLRHAIGRHHDAGLVHAACGTTAIAMAWGSRCPVCWDLEYEPQRDALLDRILDQIHREAQP